MTIYCTIAFLLIGLIMGFMSAWWLLAFAICIFLDVAGHF